MGSIREALIRNGIFYLNTSEGTFTLEDGFGLYMVARDTNGMVRYRIEGAELSNKLIVRDVSTGCVVQSLFMPF